jgi:hypothetical protein
LAVGAVFVVFAGLARGLVLAGATFLVAMLDACSPPLSGAHPGSGSDESRLSTGLADGRLLRRGALKTLLHWAADEVPRMKAPNSRQ